MALSSELISQFVKVTKDEKEPIKETTAYGKIVVKDGKEYVQLDGSELLTPISATTVVNDQDRVMVTIKNHTAIVTGDLTNPSASNKKVQEIGSKISEFEIIIADKVTTKQLEAEIAKIDKVIADNFQATNAKFETIEGKVAEIDTIKANVVEVSGKVTVNEASIKTLDANIATFKDVTANKIDAVEGNFNTLNSDYADFKVITTNKLSANEGNITKLQTEKLDAKTAEVTYANIDFSNIGEAAVEKLFSDSGIIKDLIMSDGKVTGELVGVTIKGDLIEGNTVKADKLVIQGEDGLYYKLNVNALGETTASSDEKYQNGLDGSIIVAESITAEKIAVDDLVAFGATIGGYHINNHSLYSGVKNSISNTTRGVYLGDDGQVNIGDSNNYLKFYNDNGTYKLEIQANSIRIGTSGKTVEEAVNEATEAANSAIIESIEEFYKSTSSTTLSGGSWSTSQPTWTDGTYIWRRTLITYGDGSKKYSPSETGVCITGNTGITGPQGEQGIQGIQGEQGPKGDTGEQGIQGDKGDKGDKGDTGATGKGVSKTEVFYYLSTSNTTQTGGSWSTSVPAWVDGSYYWQKIKTTFTDNTTSESTPVCITGAKGATGAAGAKGDKGDKGDTGATGSTGATGTGVESITTEYYLSTSKDSQTGGSWVPTMPTWSIGKYLWIRNKIVYKNPSSTVYTTPYCDSSWEAVNEIQIGGRNLILKSDKWSSTGYGAATGITPSLTENGELKVVTTSGNGNWHSFHRANVIEANLKDGDIFTISMEIKSDDATAPPRIYFKSGMGYYQLLGTVSTEYTTVYYTGIWKDTNDIQFHFGWSSAVGTYYIRKIKLEKGNKATDWTPAPEDFVEDIANLQTQVDGKIETFSQTTDPSTAWTTIALKNQHTGDLWYNSSTKKTQRWSGTAWVNLENAEAQAASNLASKKAQVFTSTPTIPYYKGDLWVTALDKTGIVKTCQTTRTSGSYTASDWVEGLKYTDDTAVNNLQIGARNLLPISYFSIGGMTNGLSTSDIKYRINNVAHPILVDASTEYILNVNDFGEFKGLRVGIHTCTKDGTFIHDSGWLQLKNNTPYHFITREDAESLKFVFTGSTTSEEVVTNSTENTTIYNSPEEWLRKAKIKLEKGNKPTDWTPAPEDIDQTIADTSTEIYKEITDQRTDIIAETQALILSATTDYVVTGDFETYKETVAAQLKVMSEDIIMKFTSTSDAISELDTTTSNEFEIIKKYFQFNEDGLAMGSGESAIKLRIDNDDGIIFEKNGETFGYWDGNDFYTGNIKVRVKERAQFGAYAYVPRTDHSLMFLKVD